MLKFLKKLKYGARVLLSKGGGQEEIIDVAGRSTVMRHGGEGPPLVYLHSGLGESFMWLPFFQSWSKKFRVLVPTHPGFGNSGGFDQIDNIEDMAFHYVEMLDALGLEEVCLGGVSVGGWIAAEFAVRWPERVKKLWIADAPGMWVEDQPPADMFRIMHDRDKLRELLFYDPKGAMASVVVKDDPDEQTMLTAYQSLTVLARLVWERPYDPKLPARLRRVQCPTLLIWGDHDKLIPPAYGEAYKKHIAGAELNLIKNCGHLPMFEKESEFVELIGKFCQD
ncbi:MAG: alpha/beta hydrolase [Gemmataceae bacterium]|nr:alpha/beta hydrolase [Gemmataceae bacterium]MCI0743738.1 alpha/beta hydrolase [Gemmataceae bacterium]